MAPNDHGIIGPTLFKPPTRNDSWDNISGFGRGQLSPSQSSLWESAGDINPPDLHIGKLKHESLTRGKKKGQHSFYVLCIPIFEKFPVQPIKQKRRVPSVSSPVVRDFSSITREIPPLSHASTQEREKGGFENTPRKSVKTDQIRTPCQPPVSYLIHMLRLLPSHGSSQSSTSELSATSLSLRVTAAARASSASTLATPVAAPAPAALSLKGT